MTRCGLWLGVLFSVLSLAACPERKPATEPRTVQIEEQQVKVMTNPQEVQREVETTIQQGIKARDRRMGE